MKKIAIGAGIAAGIAAIIYFVTRAEAAEPIEDFNVEVSGLTIEPIEVYVGEPVSISVLVTNIGGKRGSYEVICEVNGMIIRKSVTLNPSESKAVSFTVTPDQVKSYEVSVDGLQGSFTSYPTPEAEFAVSNLVITPSEVYVGETVSISVTVTNVGDKTGSYEVVCEVI